MRGTADRQGRHTLLAVLLLSAVCVAAYWNSFSGDFVQRDDFICLRDNPHIRQLWPWREPLSLALWGRGSSFSSRPVLSLSFALNYAVTGGALWGYHCVNLLIHIGVACGLYGVLRRTLARAGNGAHDAPAAGTALAVALLWAVHPLHTGSVTFLIQRAESLLALFYVLTLYCAIRGFEGGRRGWYALAWVSCLLGMGTKQSMATAPLIVFLYDAVFVSRSYHGVLRARGRWYAAVCLTLVPLVLLVLAAREEVACDGALVAPLRYAASQPGVVLYYLRLIAWPRPLMLEYFWPLASHIRDVVLPGIPLAVLLAATGWGLWRRTWWGFAGAWYFGILSVTSSIVPLSLMCVLKEHRTYLPSAAVIAVGVLGVRWLLAHYVARRWGVRAAHWCAIAMLCAVTAVLGTMTVARNKDYRSELVFLADNVAKRPGNWYVRSVYADALQARGQTAAAAEQYRLVTGYNPGYSPAHFKRGRALLALGRPAQAVVALTNAAMLMDDAPAAWLAAGNAYAAMHHDARARRAYEHGAARAPADPAFPLALAQLEERAGNMAAATAQVTRAQALAPHDPFVRLHARRLGLR
jgi:Flp pilus assembly protein TadD